MRGIKRGAVIIGVNDFEHRDGLHDLLFRLSGQPHHVIRPNGDTVLAANFPGFDVLRPRRPLANEFEHAVRAALEPDEEPAQSHLRHQFHHILIFDDDVSAALTEERLSETCSAVLFAKLRHPRAVFGETIIVEHETVEVILVAQFTQFRDDVRDAAAAHPPAKNLAFRGLAETAIVDTPAPRDDSHERRRQFGRERHFG